MAVVLESFTSVTDSSNVTSLTIDKPTGVTSGDFLLLLMGDDDNAGPEGSVWNAVTGWTKEVEYWDASADCSIAVYSRVADGTEGTTFTVTKNLSTEGWGFCLRLSGVDTTTGVDVIGAATKAGSTSSTLCATVTATGAGMAIGVVSTDGADLYPFSWSGTGWAEQSEVQAGTSGTEAAGTFGTKAITGAGGTGGATVTASATDGMIGFQFTVLEATASGVTGDGAFTDANDTISATGAVAIDGSAAFTDATDTIAASGGVTVSGTGAFTDAADTIAATGSTALFGSGAFTDADDSVAATGAVAIAGNAAFTDDADTIAGAGAVAVQGTAAFTDEADTVAATGAVAGGAVSGDAAFTDDADTIAATGAVAIAGSGAFTDADDTVAATGSAGVTGSGAFTDADDTIVAVGAVAISGTVAFTDNADTIAASGVILVQGTAAFTDAGDTIAATGSAILQPATGTVVFTDDADTVAAAGGVVIAGAAALVAVDDVIAANGKVIITGTGVFTDEADTIVGLETVLITITRFMVGRFYRLPSEPRLVFLQMGTGVPRGLSASEGWEKVSSIVRYNSGDENTIDALISDIWAAQSGDTAANLKAAIDEALQRAGYRLPDGSDIA